MGKSTISMAIFHCYVSSPEGIYICNSLKPPLPSLVTEAAHVLFAVLVLGCPGLSIACEFTTFDRSTIGGVCSGGRLFVKCHLHG